MTDYPCRWMTALHVGQLGSKQWPYTPVSLRLEDCLTATDSGYESCLFLLYVLVVVTICVAVLQCMCAIPVVKHSTSDDISGIFLHESSVAGIPTRFNMTIPASTATKEFDTRVALTGLSGPGQLAEPLSSHHYSDHPTMISPAERLQARRRGGERRALDALTP